MPAELELKSVSKPVAVQVLRVTIFRRKHSRYWQTKVSFGKAIKRMSTRTTIPASAREFAELLYREESRRLKKEGIKS